MSALKKAIAALCNCTSRKTLNPQTPDELAKTVRGALESLKQNRPVFHTEGDFQCELAVALRWMGMQNVRAEYPLRLLSGEDGERRRMDIYADRVAIELKHSTGGFKAIVRDEYFAAAESDNQENDSGVRDDFWKDVQRLEDLAQKNPTGLCGALPCCRLTGPKCGTTIPNTPSAKRNATRRQNTLPNGKSGAIWNWNPTAFADSVTPLLR